MGSWAWMEDWSWLEKCFYMIRQVGMFDYLAFLYPFIFVFCLACGIKQLVEKDYLGAILIFIFAGLALLVLYEGNCHYC